MANKSKGTTNYAGFMVFIVYVIVRWAMATHLDVNALASSLGRWAQGLVSSPASAPKDWRGNSQPAVSLMQPARTPDPAESMVGRIAFYPVTGLDELNNGEAGYKKLLGSLARLQAVGLRDAYAKSILPNVLINAHDNCANDKGIGTYVLNCKTIVVNYSDGNMTFEHRTEVEATLAHEWGHHLAAISNLKVSPTENEIVADCFAGVTFGYLVANGLMSQQEATEGINLMIQISNNSENDIHPNEQNRKSAFIGGMAAVAEPNGEFRQLYGQYCASLDSILDVTKVRSMGTSWMG
jgi:hypothetical protein